MKFFSLTSLMTISLLFNISFGLITESTCFNQDRVFIYNDEELEFDEAQLACQAQFPIANLIETDSTDIFFFIDAFISNEVDEDVEFWVGLSKGLVQDKESAVDPLNFSFIDGTTSAPNGFGSRPEISPWKNDAPSDKFSDERGVNFKTSKLTLSDLK